MDWAGEGNKDQGSVSLISLLNHLSCIADQAGSENTEVRYVIDEGDPGGIFVINFTIVYHRYVIIVITALLTVLNQDGITPAEPGEAGGAGAERLGWSGEQAELPPRQSAADAGGQAVPNRAREQVGDAGAL